MPLNIRTGGIHYKDPTTGNYVEIDALGDRLSETIAPDFDKTQAYNAGAYVMHSGELYLLTENHAANVTWENTSKIPTTIASAMENTGGNITQLYEEKLPYSDVAPQYDDLTFPVSKGQICVYEDGYLYEAKQDIATKEEWTHGKWQYITVGEKLTSLASGAGNFVVTTTDTEWEDVYSAWQAGYYYDPDNSYAYTQIPSTETTWSETQTYISVSCTPYSSMIPVKSGEKYKYANLPVHFDSKNAEIPSIILFDSNKDPVIAYTRTYQDTYTEFTIPSTAVWMAVIYYNNQTYVLQKLSEKCHDKSKILDDVMADYRSYSLTSPPVKNTLTKGYICIGTDDLRSAHTKNLHTMFTTNSIPYYMAAIPEAVKVCVQDDPYKTNLDYMQLCVAAGGEIVCHSDAVITSSNKNDFDTMYKYFCKNKQELESYGFKVRGIFKAGGENAIYDAADPIIDAWATHYYEFGDYFTTAFPFYNGRTLLDDWESYSSLTSTIQNIVTNKSYGIFAFHYYNTNAQTAMDTIMSALSGYTEGTDYEFVTPSQLYDLLMPTTRPSAVDVSGKIDKPVSPATGSFLTYNGSAWVAQTLSTWQGGNY